MRAAGEAEVVARKDEPRSALAIHLLQSDDIRVQLTGVAGERREVTLAALESLRYIAGQAARLGRGAFGYAVRLQRPEFSGSDEPLEIPGGELERIGGWSGSASERRRCGEQQEGGVKGSGAQSVLRRPQRQQ